VSPRSTSRARTFTSFERLPGEVPSWAREDVERAFVPRRSRELGRELETLGFAAGERVRALAELDVAGTEIDERAEGDAMLRWFLKISTASSTVSEDVSDGEPEVTHRERLRFDSAFPRTPGRGSRHPAKSSSRGDTRPWPSQVGQRPPFVALKREAASVEPGHFCVVRGGEYRSDDVPDAEERWRDGPGRPPDGRLIDGHGASQRLVPGEAS